MENEELKMDETLEENTETAKTEKTTKKKTGKKQEELEKALQVPINIVKSSGYDFIDCILGN